MRLSLKVVASQKAYRFAHDGVNILAVSRDTAYEGMALGK
jgi:hypothetical protein